MRDRTKNFRSRLDFERRTLGLINSSFDHHHASLGGLTFDAIDDWLKRAKTGQNNDIIEDIGPVLVGIGERLGFIADESRIVYAKSEEETQSALDALVARLDNLVSQLSAA